MSPGTPPPARLGAALAAGLLALPVPAAAGLRIHWALDETAGTTAADNSGNSKAGAWQGTAAAPGWSPDGIDGGAVRFSGANRDSFIAEDFAGVSGTPFTVSLWVRTTSTENDGLGYLGNGASGSQYYVLRLSGGLARANARNTTEVQTAGGPAINDDQWHHLAAVYNSSTDRRIYVDGVPAASSSASVAAFPINRFGIGALTRNTPYNPADLYTGLIDDAALWDRSLTPVEIAVLRSLVLLGAGNAGDLDPLFTAFAAESTIELRGAPWQYAAGLTGAPGSSGGTVAAGDAFVVLDTGGRGMRLATPVKPAIVSFAADRTALQPGMPAVLTWRIFNAESATLTGAGPVNATEGELTVNPAATTTYTLTAANPQGTTAGTITISVATGLEIPVISEFVAQNTSGLTDEDGSAQDWIEMANPSAFPISLAGYALTDDPAIPDKWPMPALELAPGEFLVIFASGKNRTLPGSPLHTSFSLNAAGEYLALTKIPDQGGPASIIQAFSPAFPGQLPDTAYGGAADGSTGYLGTPTPGTPNSAASFSGFVSGKVSFGTRGGVIFRGTAAISLTHPDPAATIRYTTDGTPPSATSPAFNPPLSLSATTVLKTAAFRDGFLPGPVGQEAYLFADPSLTGFSSNLPVLVIDTFGTPVPRNDTAFKDSVFAAFGPGASTGRTSLTLPPDENGASGIHVRGESSQLSGFNKLNFSFETRNAEGRDKDVPLFGFPADSDWALHASEIDRTFIRDRLPHFLFNEIGRYSSRTRPVEVFLNQGSGPVNAADYRGVYLLIERVKRGPDRVDIARLGPLENAPPRVTGGYIFKKDKSDPGEVLVSTPGAGSFAVTYPPEDRITSAQTSYLQTFLRSFETALSSPAFTDPADGYAPFIDVRSWIDFHVIQEFTKEVDSYTISTYYYKDRNRPVDCGPLWDFDRSFGNTNAADEASPQGWRGGSIGNRGPFWSRLFHDPDFLQRYIDRWQELMESTLSTARLNPVIDAMAAEVGEAQQRNFQPTGPWPLANVTRSHLTFPTYVQHVDYLKNWIRDRLAWVETQFTRKPQFDRPGGSFDTPFLLSLAAPAGNIYFTTDGRDPRAPGGAVAGTLYTAPVPVGATTTVIARARLGTAWSGPLTGSFISGAPASAQSLAIAEIMYHPAAPTTAEIDAGFTDAELFEYVEFLNIGSGPIDLTGVTVSGAFDFQFSAGALSTLLPGQRLLLVRHAAAFAARYGPGLPVAGSYGNPAAPDGGARLDNGGEQIILTAADQSGIRNFSYSDTAPWPTAPDGTGASLTLISPASNPDPGDPRSWRSSAGTGSPSASGTTPFSADPHADDNTNGIPNLAEYALGSGTTGLSASLSGDWATVRVPVNLASEGIESLLETSPDLTIWTGGPDLFEYLGEERLSSTQSIQTFRTLLPATPGTPRYFRLRTSLTTP